MSNVKVEGRWSVATCDPWSLSGIWTVLGCRTPVLPVMYGRGPRYGTQSIFAAVDNKYTL